MSGFENQQTSSCKQDADLERAIARRPTVRVHAGTLHEDLAWTPGGPLPRLASPHDGGASVLFADGSVRFLGPTIVPTTLLSILTKNGGEVLSGG